MRFVLCSVAEIAGNFARLAEFFFWAHKRLVILLCCSFVGDKILTGSLLILNYSY